MKNGVEKKTVRITQEDCDCARFLMRKGYTVKSIANTLKCDPSTVSKIKAADFRLEAYLENRKESNRKDADRKKKEKMRAELREQAAKDRETIMEQEKKRQAQLAGQIEMDLKAAEAKLNINPDEVKQEMSEAVKMKRFLAGQIGEIVKALNGITEELKKLNDRMQEMRKE